jgi:hypothetical protein
MHASALKNCRHHPAGRKSRNNLEPMMQLTAAHISPIAAIVAGVLILIMPRILNYVVALFLIIFGLTGLNNIHHFLR